MAPIQMERVEESLRLALGFAQAFNRHDTQAIAALLAEECVFESAGPAPLGSRHEGRVAATQAIQRFFDTIPALRMEIEDAYGSGQRSVLRWKLTGIEGFPEGRRGVDLFTVRKGQIVEILAYAKG